MPLPCLLSTPLTGTTSCSATVVLSEGWVGFELDTAWMPRIWSATPLPTDGSGTTVQNVQSWVNFGSF